MLGTLGLIKLVMATLLIARRGMWVGYSFRCFDCLSSSRGDDEMDGILDAERGFRERTLVLREISLAEGRESG